jgi:hypothetical protein
MIKFIKSIVLIIALLIHPVIVFSATWYLSPTGSNATGNGSIGSPWFSPTKARKSQSDVAPGDTVIFLNGVYSYDDTSCMLGYSGDDSGTAENPITYKAEDTTHSVFLHCSENHYGWRLDGVNGSAYIVLDGFVITNTGCGVRFKDDHQTAKNIYITSRSEDSWPPSGVALWGGSQGAISSMVNADHPAYVSGGTNFLAENCIVDTFSTDTSGHGVYCAGGSGTVRNCIFRNIAGNCIQIQSKIGYEILGDFNIHHCTMYGSGLANGIYSSVYASTGVGSVGNLTIYNNLIWDNAQYGITIKVENSGTYAGVYIYNNTIYSNLYGIRLSEVTSGVFTAGAVRNNIVVGNNTDLTSTYHDVTSVTKSNNLTSAGTEGDGYGVIGSFATADFVSTDSANADYLKIDVANNAIDAGYDVSATVTDDYWAEDRDASIDVGADEYVPSVDEIAPTVTGIAGNGDQIVVTFSETVVTTGYDAGDLKINAGGADINLSDPTGTGSTRTFTAATAIEFGQTVTCDYSGGAGDITDDADTPNVMATFTDTAVTNNTPDTTNPEIAITTPADNPHDNGETATITIEGTASDNDEVSSVTWVCQTCSTATGTVTGTTTWSQLVTLAVDSSTITFTAHDPAGNTVQDSVVVTRSSSGGSSGSTRTGAGAGTSGTGAGAGSSSFGP